MGQLKIHYLKSFLIAILISSLLIILTGPKEQVFIGESEYWIAKLTQKANPEFIEIKFIYNGNEEFLTSIGYKFTGEDFSPIGFEPISHKPPYVYVNKYQKIGGEKINSNSLQVNINWNDKKETIVLQKTQ